MSNCLACTVFFNWWYVFEHYMIFFDSLYQAGTRRPLAFSPSTDMGLTDIEMAHNLDYDDPYFDDRVGYEMEYEVLNCFLFYCLVICLGQDNLGNLSVQSPVCVLLLSVYIWAADQHHFKVNYKAISICKCHNRNSWPCLRLNIIVILEVFFVTMVTETPHLVNIRVPCGFDPCKNVCLCYTAKWFNVSREELYCKWYKKTTKKI